MVGFSIRSFTRSLVFVAIQHIWWHLPLHLLHEMVACNRKHRTNALVSAHSPNVAVLGMGLPILENLSALQ